MLDADERLTPPALIAALLLMSPPEGRSPRRSYESVAREVRADMLAFTNGVGRRWIWNLTEAERSRWAELLVTRQLVEDLFAQLDAREQSAEAAHA